MTETNPENMFAIGRLMRVRKLTGIYKITDSWMMLGKKRRYQLEAVPGSGATLRETEAFGADLHIVPDPEPTPELSIAPDPGSATAPQEHASPAGHPEPAPGAEHAVADVIRSPADATEADVIRGMNAALDAGAFGGELDEYSVGANLEDVVPGSQYRYENADKLQNPLKPIRSYPENPTYRDLKCIVYNARFKGLEKLTMKQLDELPEKTPIAVAVTHETNGHAIWVVITDGAEKMHRARLEVFYPHAPGSAADAIEYAVLLALRQVPIRSEDLEILLLELN